MRKYLDFTRRPKPFRVEAVQFIGMAVMLFGMAFVLRWNDYTGPMIIMATWAVVTVLNYIWWHFKPPKPAPV